MVKKSSPKPTTPETPSFSSWSYTLPFPPSVNSYWQHDKLGRTWIGKAGKKFRKIALKRITERPLSRRRLAIKIELLGYDEREYDLDNFVKGIQDALQHAKVYANDSQIDDLHVVRGIVCPPGYCNVTVTETGYAKSKITVGKPKLSVRTNQGSKSKTGVRRAKLSPKRTTNKSSASSPEGSYLERLKRRRTTAGEG